MGPGALGFWESGRSKARLEMNGRGQHTLAMNPARRQVSAPRTRWEKSPVCMLWIWVRTIYKDLFDWWGRGRRPICHVRQHSQVLGIKMWRSLWGRYSAYHNV